MREASTALGELGVADAIVSAGVSTRQVEIRRVDGQVIKRFSGQLAGPTLVALRSVLHGALLSAVGDAALRLGREVVSYDVLEAGVRVRFQDGGTETGAVLVGADGVSSVVRKQLHPWEPPPRPSGFCSLRGVAYGVGDSLGELGAVAYLDAGIEAATLRASSDAVYWYFSLLVNDLPEARQRDPHRPLRADATV